jgi:hypothetical protein
MVTALLADQFGVRPTVAEFGCDVDTYRLTNPRQRKGIVFYAKPNVARRGLILGMLALRDFHERYPDHEIHLFGDRDARVPFSATNHGTLRRGARGRHDPLLLICRDLRVDRQRQDLGGRLLGVREGLCPGQRAGVGVGGGEVDRRRHEPDEQHPTIYIGHSGDDSTKPEPAGTTNEHDYGAEPKQHDQTKCGCRIRRSDICGTRASAQDPLPVWAGVNRRMSAASRAKRSTSLLALDSGWPALA